MPLKINVHTNKEFYPLDNVVCYSINIILSWRGNTIAHMLIAVHVKNRRE